MSARLIASDNVPGIHVYHMADEVIIGREANVQIRIPDFRVSRRHCRIFSNGDEYVLEDMGSSNGTILNGLMIKRQVLRDGDRIAIGQYAFTFEETERPAPSLTRTPHTEAHQTQPFDHSLDASIVHFVEASEREEVDAAAIERAHERLGTLQTISEAIGTVMELDQLLEKIMDQLFAAFTIAERGFIMLLDKTCGELVPAVTRYRSDVGPDEPIAVSQSVISKVMEERRAILSMDAMDDDRFNVQQSIAQFSIRSMMCTPLLCAGEVLGIIHIDTTIQARQFERDDLVLLIGIAAQAAQAIQNAELVKAKEREMAKRASLERYFSPAVVEAMMNGDISMELGGEMTAGTVLFADIVGFTAMSETMEPSAVVQLLNRYFLFINDIIFRHTGCINKFGGDAVLALWGVIPKDRRHPVHALEAALEMQNTLFRFNVHLQNPIGMGIGINTGRFLAGNVGSEAHREFTVIGDAVNLTQRVEALATRGQIMLTHAARTQISPSLALIGFEPVSVKGKKEPIRVYSVRGIRSEEFENIIHTSIPGEASLPHEETSQLMITSATWNSQGIVLEAEMQAALEPETQVMLRPEMPEMPVASFPVMCSAQSEELPGVFSTYFVATHIPGNFSELLHCRMLQGGRVGRLPRL